MNDEPDVIELYNIALKTTEALSKAEGQAEEAVKRVKQTENDKIDAWYSFLESLRITLTDCG
ncbi:hypothetical protein LCGC14_3046360, partial [marine sediment metagenome]